ncbi:MAG TPA: ATP synthase F0 subunit B [Syntrophorhabdaceae bacterium]|nr:ATP synthase F0 subunit B [Syntrophorhabdaceae bacterium]HPP06142.1 ATP synthase F0 subunit B [Syntrophorhabdaceae bacterium]
MSGGSESWLDWVFKFINFAVLVGLLIKFAGKPLKNYLANRHKAIKQKYEDAERALKEAEALKAQYEEKLSRLNDEIEAFKKSVMEETEREKQKILAEANQFAARIKEQARLTYEQEAKEIMGRIKEEIAKMTMEKTEKILREKFSKSDHMRMVDEFIEKIRSMN